MRILFFGSSCHVFEVHFANMMLPQSMKRASVCFKSFSQFGIFIVEQNRITFPGGKIEAGETYVSAAVRQVTEKLGGWPSTIAPTLDTAVSVDCGITRYFVVSLDDFDFRTCFKLIDEYFYRRHGRQMSEISMLLWMHPDQAVDDARLHPEVHDLLAILADQAASMPLHTRVVEPARSVFSRYRSIIADQASSRSLHSQAVEPASTVLSRKRRRTPQCNGCDRNIVTLWRCDECDAQFCTTCIFWCTSCPWYSICFHCMRGNTLLVEVKRGKVWACRKCQ